MKKYTYSNLNWVLMSLIIPILLFFFVMNTAYAFFTASAPQQTSSITTAVLKIDMEDLTAKYYEVRDVNTATNKTWVALAANETVLPGYIFQINGSVENTGTESMYSLIRLQVFIGDSTTATHTEYYTTTVTGSGASATYAYTESITTTDASAILPSRATASFALEYQLPFGDNDTSEDENKNVKFVVSAGGIQTRSLTDVNATSEIIAILG